jgi:hypothetical protein
MLVQIIVMDMENVEWINVNVITIGLDQNVNLQWKIIVTIDWIMIMVRISNRIVYKEYWILFRWSDRLSWSWLLFIKSMSIDGRMYFTNECKGHVWRLELSRKKWLFWFFVDYWDVKLQVHRLHFLNVCNF